MVDYTKRTRWVERLLDGAEASLGAALLKVLEFDEQHGGGRVAGWWTFALGWGCLKRSPLSQHRHPAASNIRVSGSAKTDQAGGSSPSSRSNRAMPKPSDLNCPRNGTAARAADNPRSLPPSASEIQPETVPPPPGIDRWRYPAGTARYKSDRRPAARRSLRRCPQVVAGRDHFAIQFRHLVRTDHQRRRFALGDRGLSFPPAAPSASSPVRRAGGFHRCPASGRRTVTPAAPAARDGMAKWKRESDDGHRAGFQAWRQRGEQVGNPDNYAESGYILTEIEHAYIIRALCKSQRFPTGSTLATGRRERAAGWRVAAGGAAAVGRFARTCRRHGQRGVGGGVDEQGLRFIEGSLQTEVERFCQRCLGPLRLPLREWRSVWR